MTPLTPTGSIRADKSCFVFKIPSRFLIYDFKDVQHAKPGNILVSRCFLTRGIRVVLWTGDQLLLAPTRLTSKTDNRWIWWHHSLTGHRCTGVTRNSSWNLARKKVFIILSFIIHRAKITKLLTCRAYTFLIGWVSL